MRTEIARLREHETLHLHQTKEKMLVHVREQVFIFLFFLQFMYYSCRLACKHGCQRTHTHTHAHIHTHTYSRTHTHTHMLSLSHTHTRACVLFVFSFFFFFGSLSLSLPLFLARSLFLVLSLSLALSLFSRCIYHHAPRACVPLVYSCSFVSSFCSSPFAFSVSFSLVCSFSASCSFSCSDCFFVSRCISFALAHSHRPS